MITLITGTPGSGKTAWVLNELVDLRRSEPDRLIYIHGVRNLRGIAHDTIYCRSQLCDICRGTDIPENAMYVEEWPSWKQSGALVVVDEVQRIWRPRSGGALPPSVVSTLETHRHYGIDFWLISQGPHLFDNFIRLLVGRHVHLVAKWNGRSQYEWPECKQDVQSRSDAVIRGYTLPKRVYSMYDSAEKHTKILKRWPLSVYFVAVFSLVEIGLSYRVYTRLSPKINSQGDHVVAGAGALAPAPATTFTAAPPSLAFPDYKPVIDGVPESAPAYAHLIKVTAAPILAGCLETTDKCSCYTAQATPYPATKAYCHEVVSNNRFNPYLHDRNNQPDLQQNIDGKI